jgi:hypothetical protein
MATPGAKATTTDARRNRLTPEIERRPRPPSGSPGGDPYAMASARRAGREADGNDCAPVRPEAGAGRRMTERAVRRGDIARGNPAVPLSAYLRARAPFARLTFARPTFERTDADPPYLEHRVDAVVRSPLPRH